MRVLELSKIFRPGTSHTYPPFKKGRYMEEYVYDYLMEKKEEIKTDLVYLPVFWTNLQNHPNWSLMKNNYQIMLDKSLILMEPNTKYFTIVQHDDGVGLKLPEGTMIFGACEGTIPLPLIYEDITERLLNTPRIMKKNKFASFVGTYTTHSLRVEMFRLLGRKKEICWDVKGIWNVSVPEENAKRFIQTTLQSRFCLAPRGYGRSSFRFFEAMLLDTIPVYFWDDKEWLPYKEKIDYSTFSVSIHKNDLLKTVEILKSITKDKYNNMVDELKKVRKYFTLEGMCEYIVERISEV
jgi:Exostosin family